jgi:hypothetical protein
MLGFLAENYPKHPLALEADTLLEALQKGPGKKILPSEIQADNQDSPPKGNKENWLTRVITHGVGSVGSPSWQRLSKIIRLAFLCFGAMATISYFLKDRYHNVEDVLPVLLKAPMQRPLKNLNPIQFSKDGYHYALTPRHEYTLHGLIVSLRDYTFMSYRKSDSVFPMDLCVIWGSNLVNRIHQNPNISFSQHGRFCMYRSTGFVPFHGSELSNNHILLATEDLKDVLVQLAPGDQIRLHGRLVDVDAHLLEHGGPADPAHFKMKTSTQRNDTGGGACEIIYTDEIEILKPANRSYRILFSISFWVFLLLGAIICIRLLWLPFANTKGFRA